MIIVLGDGLLATEIVKQTGWTQISRKRDAFDLTNVSTWRNLLDEATAIVNCIAYTKTYDSDRDRNWKVNVIGVKSLIEFCNQRSIKLIHISTDYVYSGSVHQASEEDVPVHLPTWYGYSKLVGDALVQLESANYLICRESHKPYPFPYDKAWNDQLTNGDFVTTVSAIIIDLINKNATGLYNVGTHLKTWHSLTVDEFNTAQVNRPSFVPADISMNISKLTRFQNQINKEVVIAAYDRDYSWINQLDSSVKATVYRKGGTCDLTESEIYLANNVGRDVHTFFYHIVNRYDTLADFTFFSQDYPFDHVDNYIDLINGDFLNWKANAIYQNEEIWFFDTCYGQILQTDKFGNPNHSSLDLEPVWDRIFSEPCPESLGFVAAGHFCASRKQIHKKPKEFYEKILRVLEDDPISPWCIERFEIYIFS
jgi:dTDP-4-dehydrorhamnose reductase